MTRPIVLIYTDPKHTVGIDRAGESANQVRYIYTHSYEDTLVIAHRIACDAVLLDSAGDLIESCGQVEQLREIGYTDRVVVRLPDASADACTRLLAAGAAAVLPRANSAAVVLAVLREIFRRCEEPGLQKTDERLSPRDRTVLQLVWDGYSNKEIAARLECSISLVKASLQRCFAKAGVHTRTQLLRRVIEDRKWIQPPAETAPSR